MSAGFVYLDSSVALAHVLVEDRRPPDELWSESLIASRLLEYESWVRLQRRGLANSHGDALQAVLERVALLEMIEPIMGAAVEPIDGNPRTLDALHLASMLFLVDEGQRVRLATYDHKLAAIARTAGIEPYPL